MDAKTTVRTGVELWNARDRDGFLALFDEHATLIDPATGEELRGRDHLGTDWYDAMMSGYPDREIRDAVIFGEGDLVCLQGRLVATHSGTWQGPAGDMPPTGRRIDTPFAQIFEVRDGRVTRMWMYSDRLQMLEQEGLASLDRVLAAGAASATRAG